MRVVVLERKNIAAMKTGTPHLLWSDARFIPEYRDTILPYSVRLCSWLYESNALLLLWKDIKVNDAFSSYLQATLAILDKLDIETENPTEEEVARKFGWEDDYLADDLSLWQRVKPKIFSLFDEPHSSTCARVR